VRIPESELEIAFVRASGPGGQNVNKTSTKAQLHWNVDHSAAFSDMEKAMIRERLASRINLAGEVVLSASAERSQEQNRATVIKRLEQLVTQALKPVLPRKKTRPTKSSKEKRLATKKIHSKKKKLRSFPQNGS